MEIRRFELPRGSQMTISEQITMQRFTEFINTANEKLAAELISPNAIFHVQVPQRR
jgi:hypothetical protein